LLLIACSAAPRPYAVPESNIGLAEEERQDEVLAWTHPASWGFAAWPIEVVEIEVEPGVRLRGVYARPGNYSAPTVLLLAGSGPRVVLDRDGGEANDFGPFLSLLEDSFAVLAVDYRGRGESDGQFDREHVRSDASALWKEAVRRAGRPDALIVRASSIGALALEELLRIEIEPAAIVALAPDASARLERPARSRGVRWLRRDDVDRDELGPAEMGLYGRAFPAMGFARWYPPACALRDWRIPVHEVPSFVGRRISMDGSR
jgi:pimeloyl-ACP methyl ester carboxylesterase